MLSWKPSGNWGLEEHEPSPLLHGPAINIFLFQTLILCLASLCIRHSDILRFWGSVQFSRSVMSDSATSWTAACQASLSITNSWSPSKPMSIESVMPSNHLILCRPLLSLPLIFPSIRVFSNESALHIRWPKYWSFSFNISPSNELPGPISFRMDWLVWSLSNYPWDFPQY